ncbi:MAG: TIGR04282 family arsenosugar biosynthesis glycosyltransferase [Balneolia bacterium]|nr:TIGR04282 family arsenosugar biosynthesis glycosyltransferase [Balneolia bacterium]
MGKQKKRKQALIVFLKAPEAGKVKTRLAADTGAEKAMKVYKTLISLTLKRARDFGDAQTFLFLAGDESWKPENSNGFHIRRQTGSDLGERMKNAFIQLLKEGFESVCIIGSDCPGITESDLDSAFSSLDAVDVVIGPARDGGYYLLGMKEDQTDVFGLEAWSHSDVFEETMRIIRNKKLSYAQLRPLSDLDDITDYNRMKHLLEADIAEAGSKNDG